MRRVHSAPHAGPSDGAPASAAQAADVLIHSDHLIGIGHYVRVRALVCAALRLGLRVTWCLGSDYPKLLAPPPEAFLCPLPPLYAGGAPLADAAELRRRREHRIALLTAAVDQARPRVLVIESFPFGRWTLLGELLPLLEAARRLSPRPLCVCSLRDIPALPVEHQRRHERLLDIDALLAEFFDAVTWHADPQLLSPQRVLSERALPVPLFCTGYIDAQEDRAEPADDVTALAAGALLACVGSGAAGYPLLSALLEAAECGLLAHRPLVLLAGPRLSASALAELAARVHRVARVQLLPCVPRVRPLLERAAVAVAQAGYNTCMDLLSARPPTVLVPVEQSGDQVLRTELLAAAGCVVPLREPEVTPVHLTAAIARAQAMPRRYLVVDRGGAPATAALWERWVREGSVA